MIARLVREQDVLKGALVYGRRGSVCQHEGFHSSKKLLDASTYHVFPVFRSASPRMIGVVKE